MYRFLIAPLLGLCCFGAGFTTEAICRYKNGAVTIEDHGALSCQASERPYGFAKVNNSVFATDASSGVTAFDLRVDKRMESLLQYSRPYGFGSFQSSIAYSQRLATAGEWRFGYISYDLDPGLFSANVDAWDFEDWAVGPYSGRNNGGRGSIPADGAGRFLLPFALGSSFLVSMQSTAYPAGEYNLVYGRSYLSFVLYEADGVTPVVMYTSHNPEPSTFFLAGLSLMGLALIRKRKGGGQ